MKTVWNIINNIEAGKDTKTGAFIILTVIFFAAAGAFLWAVAGKLVFPGAEGLFCFSGYPSFFAGLFGGTYYICNHEFC